MRYLPNTAKTRKEMLDIIGISHVDELYSDVPDDSLNPQGFDLPDHQGELEVENHMAALANKNHSTSDWPSFLGAGYYKHHIPATVDYLIQRGEFLTAYTPYQPEVSQGTLTAIFTFQSYICNLTGQDVANASMYDGATATAEAALMARRITKRENVHVVNGLHPHYDETLDTYLHNTNAQLQDNADDSTACIIVQTPNFFGEVVDINPYRTMADNTGALLVVVVTEIISLGMLPEPEAADIVVGEGQSLGNPLSFGGPSLGFFACKQKYLRQMPGRICGQTTDTDGKTGYVLTLNTREQHIRRDKATSNICTNEGLCALAFTIHLSLLGEIGLKKLAKLNHAKACELADTLETIGGISVANATFFNEFVINTVKPAAEIEASLTKQNIIPGLVIGENQLLVTATEMTSQQDIQTFASKLQEVCA